MTFAKPDAIDKVNIPIPLNVLDWSVVLTGLKMLETQFNGMEDNDGMNISELASEVYIKIKTRSHDAVKKLC